MCLCALMQLLETLERVFMEHVCGIYLWRVQRVLVLPLGPVKDILEVNFASHPCKNITRMPFLGMMTSHSHECNNSSPVLRIPCSMVKRMHTPLQRCTSPPFLPSKKVLENSYTNVAIFTQIFSMNVASFL